MNIDIIQQVKDDFYNNKNTLQFNYQVIKKRIASKELSKGKLYNVIPFENESDGFKKGRAIKSLPQDMKNIVIYGFSEFNKIILIEEYGTVPNPARELFYHSDDVMKRYKYDTTGHLMSVKYVMMQNSKVKEVYHYAEYGFSYQKYLYDNDILVKITSQEKEHVKEGFSPRDINYYYDDSNVLYLIEQDNLNGNIQELYPKLGKWRTMSKATK